MKNDMFRACRLFLGMTQEEFAEFLGISKAVVGRIEHGSLAISPRVKAKFVSKFDIDNSFLDFYEKMSREL